MNNGVAAALFGKCWRNVVHTIATERVSLAKPHDPELGSANPCCVRQRRLEHRFQLARRTRNDPQHFRRRRLLLHRLGKVPPRLGKLTSARFELLFQLDQCIGSIANARSRFRSGRTKLAATRSPFRAFARRGHVNRPHAEDQAFRGKENITQARAYVSQFTLIAGTIGCRRVEPAKIGGTISEMRLGIQWSGAAKWAIWRGETRSRHQLLRAPRERPRSRAAEQRDERA